MIESAFLSIDLPAYMVALLAGLSGGLVGALLLLKKQTMMADALSHSILPGLALAYIVTGTMGALALFSGAFASCLLAGALIYGIQRITTLNANMAMGITLTSMFAFGVILLELFIDGRVHLDTEHALYGALELIYWEDPGNFATVPEQIITLFIVSILVILVIGFGHRHLKLALFDPDYANMHGFSELKISAIILVLTVIVAVASFDAVGSILVLALFAGPPACARMVTDQFSRQIVWSGLIGAACAMGGYFSGAVLPPLLGFENSLSAAGSIAVLAGLTQLCFIVFAPEYGVLAQIEPKKKKSKNIGQ